MSAIRLKGKMVAPWAVPPLDGGVRRIRDVAKQHPLHTRLLGEEPLSLMLMLIHQRSQARLLGKQGVNDIHCGGSSINPPPQNDAKHHP
jgi:hypothetical protein